VGCSESVQLEQFALRLARFAMDTAVRQAKTAGHDVKTLDRLVVEEVLPRVPGILRVDRDRRKLVVEPHSPEPVAGRESAGLGPARTRRKKKPTPLEKDAHSSEKGLK
jgi:hypothetical protein